MIIEIPGEPIPLQRHRSYVKNAKIACYDPNSQSKGVIKLVMRNALQRALECEDRAVAMEAAALATAEHFTVNFLFFFLPPTAWSRRKIIKLFEHTETIPHYTRPDIDNLIKFYLDCGNGIIWADDAMISEISAGKIYAKQQKVFISVKPHQPQELA